jgi:kumamolisin
MTANPRFLLSGEGPQTHPIERSTLSSIEQIAARYGFPHTLTGKGECIAILAFGGSASPTDMARFFRQQTGIVPDLHFERIRSSNSPNINSRHDLEVALDIQLAGSLAPGARIVAYFSTDDERGWLDTVFRAIHDDKNQPTILSISWGATEDWWSSHTLQSLNTLFEEAAHRGITICGASGDGGCAWDANGHCRVTFPASSPFILACGGTTLEPGDVEIVWNLRNVSASGGGISDRIARPPWQSLPSDLLNSPVPPRRNSHFDGRQLPDVCGLASNFYSVYLGGRYQNGAGGTSAVAPVWSALIARLNEGLRLRGCPRVGHFHPLLYRSPLIQQSFRGVTVGHNDPFGFNGYRARPGWNPCTGWGAPDGLRLLHALYISLGGDHARVD